MGHLPGFVEARQVVARHEARYKQRRIVTTETATPTPILSVRGTSKSFSGVRAVNQVDMNVQPGERRAVIGPNGAGKTTLFNLITGVIPSDSGTISMFGKNVTRQSVRKRANLGLGRTYQISNLFLELTVEESLILAANPQKVPSLVMPWQRMTPLRETVAGIAEQVGLQDRLQAAVRDLSHGEQRQLELGMAVAPSPRLIMMDEPAAGLSPSERALMMRLIRNLGKEVTVILIEHDMDIVLNVTEWITVMHQGQVIAEGSPETIRADQRVQEVYMGEWDLDG
jgi:branched-chain amino acid transport system ATP-binding protein